MTITEKERKDLIEKYKKYILNGLPEWNHTGSDEEEILEQKRKFSADMDALSEIDIDDSNVVLRAMKRVIANDVPDSHIKIVGGKGAPIEKYPEILKFFEDRELKPIEPVSYQNFSENPDLIPKEEQKDFKIFNMPTYDESHPQIPVLIGTHQKDGKNIGIIAAASFEWRLPSDVRGQMTAIKSEFMRQMKENHWDAVCVDVRGNGGGEKHLFSELVDEIAGQNVPSATSIEPLILSQNSGSIQEQIFKEQVLCTAGFNNEMFPTVEMGKIFKEIAENGGEISAEQRLKLADEWAKYPAQTDFCPDESKMKFKGKVAVLTDENVGSSGELATFKISLLPNSVQIGHHTMGCYQGAYSAVIDMGHDSFLSMGVAYQVRQDREGNLIKEKEGQNPDIECNPNKAYEYALAFFNSPESAKEFRRGEKQDIKKPFSSRVSQLKMSLDNQSLKISQIGEIGKKLKQMRENRSVNPSEEKGRFSPQNGRDK